VSDAVSAFVAHGLGAHYADLPQSARAAVRTFLLDSLGVGIAGAAAPLTQPIRQVTQKWTGSGVPGRAAHVWGEGSFATTPASAAFINGFQIHCQEFDCVHEKAVVHPLATILAALMADIEGYEGKVSGQDLAMALVVAVDLAAGMGVAVSSPIRFFRPANAGLFGATLGIARLRRFTEEQTKDALGYALSFCSGTMQAHVEGKPALPVQIAAAARGAILACDLAEAGMTGPHDSLEGPYGYFALFETDYDLAPVIASLGSVWRIAEVSHKPFPTGRACQGGIVLMQKLSALGVTAANVKTITLTAPPLIHRLVGRSITTDMTANYARLCFQYAGAVALRQESVGLGSFGEGALRDDSTLALGRKIRVIDDGTKDPAAFVPQIAIATLVDGTKVEARIDRLFGSPAEPLSPAQNVSKFRDCAAFGFGAPRTSLENKLITLTETLETLDDAAILARLAAGMETNPT
jgi:2-methylcitrate dehydratase PrpD